MSFSAAEQGTSCCKQQRGAAGPESLGRPEEGARVEGRTPALRRRLEPASHQLRALDEGVDLRELAPGDRLKARRYLPSVVGVEQLAYIGEAESRALTGGDHRESPQRLRPVAPPTCNSLGRGQQPDLLVVADGRRPQARPPR